MSKLKKRDLKYSLKKEKAKDEVFALEDLYPEAWKKNIPNVFDESIRHENSLKFKDFVKEK